MRRYCAGDTAAFATLYERVAPRLFGYLRNLIGERATAEDLLQQTFMKLHQARDTYIADADPVPWMYTIAHRTCLDEMRRRARAKVRLTIDGEFAHEPVAPDAMTSANEAADGAELTAKALAALSVLPPNQRAALVLTRLEGHTHAQAATIAGTTEGAIKLRVHRAYETLRQRLSRGQA